MMIPDFITPFHWFLGGAIIISAIVSSVVAWCVARWSNR